MINSANLKKFAPPKKGAVYEKNLDYFNYIYWF